MARPRKPEAEKRGQGAPPELTDLIARINALLDELYGGELADDPEG